MIRLFLKLTNKVLGLTINMVYLTYSPSIFRSTTYSTTSISALWALVSMWRRVNMRVGYLAARDA